jgi:hypothetical protein
VVTSSQCILIVGLFYSLENKGNRVPSRFADTAVAAEDEGSKERGKSLEVYLGRQESLFVVFELSNVNKFLDDLTMLRIIDEDNEYTQSMTVLLKGSPSETTT